MSYGTAYSQAVTHPSTNAAQCCLTSVIRRELVFSTWYGRRQDRRDFRSSLRNLQQVCACAGWLCQCETKWMDRLTKWNQRREFLDLESDQLQLKPILIRFEIFSPTCGLTWAIWLNSVDPILNLKTSNRIRIGLSFWWGLPKFVLANYG